MKIAKITLALGALSLFSLSAGAQENARLSSVKQFADVVLDKAGDRYGYHSPLLVPMAWILAPASKWNGFFRTVK